MISSVRLQEIRRLTISFPHSWNDSSLEFSVTTSKESDISWIKDLSAKGVLSDTFQHGDVYHELKELHSLVGKEIKLISYVGDWVKNGEFVYEDMDHLLGYRPNLENIPGQFYLIKENLLYPTDEPEKNVKHYIEIVSFLKLLLKQADYREKINENITERVFFLHRGKLEIPIKYGSADINETLDGFSIMAAHLGEGSHEEQKSSIFKEVLYGLLLNVPVGERLSFILRNFGEFSRRFDENYHLFVSEFSFDKVRREFEEKKREYLIKINDSFSSISAKLLSIPIAFYFAFSGIKPFTEDASYFEVLIQNVAILMTIGLVSAYMIILVTNQMHSLKAIKSEYVSLMSRLKNSYPQQFELVQEAKDDLDARSSSIRKYLLFSLFSSIATFLAVAILFSLRFEQAQIFYQNTWLAILCLARNIKDFLTL